MKRIGGTAFFDRLEEIVDPSHSALLVVDMQNDFCDAAGHFARAGRDVGRISAIVPETARFVERAREASVFVAWTRQVTLPEGRSDSPAWIYFKTRDGKGPDYTLEGSWGAEIVPALRPLPGEPVVDKHRPSAFLGTDLDRLLRDRGIETVVVAGCLTQGCVQATVTDASYHDYYAVVVEDLVQSTSGELHDNALRFLRSRYDVVPSERLVTTWEARR